MKVEFSAISSLEQCTSYKIQNGAPEVSKWPMGCEKQSIVKLQSSLTVQSKSVGTSRDHSGLWGNSSWKLVCLYPMPHYARENGTNQFLAKFWPV